MASAAEALYLLAIGLAAAVAARNGAGDSRVKAYQMVTTNPSPGCDYHPTVATQQAMATELMGELAQNLRW